MSQQRIDAKGKPCPQPVVLAKQAITGGADGFIIEVDNQTAVENLRRLAASQGYQAAVEEAGGIYSLQFERSGVAACEMAPAGSYTVFVGRDIIGSGDRELGTGLMRMFFYTLAQSDALPRSVLFMNAGVKLPAEDEQVQEHLKFMADRGVEILVCGTCLNFYGLTEKLQVGTVSNMYDIVAQMQQANKVITV